MVRCVATFVIAALAVVFGKSNGTVSTPDCVTMLPGGHGSPQTSECPYFVAVETTYFVRNIFLRVHLEAPATAAPFKEYYCQARTSSNEIVGQFQVDANVSQGHSCSSRQDIFDAVSQSSSWQQNPRRMVLLRWKVATTLWQSIEIRCTFVQDNSTFWVGEASMLIRPIQSSTYEECCSEEQIPSACTPLCKNITEPATQGAINILQGLINDYDVAAYEDDYVEDNVTCDYENARLALRCSYWSQPGFHMDPSVVRDCCGDGVAEECMVFCNKNLYAAMNYLETNYTYCFFAHPQLLSCILQPVQGSILYVTEEASTYTTEIGDFYTSALTTADAPTTETTDGVTSTPTAFSTARAELPGRTIFTITTTVNVSGAMQNETLRRTIFQALENDLLIPALAKVPRYVEVRTGVDYYEGSLVVSSEGVYQQQSDGSVPSTSVVTSELTKRLQAIDGTITLGKNAWTVSPPINVSHKAINQRCESVSCNDGATCVEVGPDGTTCVCETASCNSTDSGLSTGALIGIIIGVVALLVIIGVTLYVLTRRKSAMKKDTKRRKSARSNHAYEDPLYMDISSVEPEPPKLPPDRNVGNLPSNSTTYEMPAKDVTGSQVQSFRKISEGYVVGVMEESTEDLSKNKGEYSYAAYDVTNSTNNKAQSDRDYDDHILKTGEYGYAAYDVSSSTKRPTEGDQDYDDDHLNTETTGFAAPAEDVINKQNVARYESLSGYEHAVDSAKL